MSQSLDGKTAVVTGASSGIGAATAEALAREGADVVVAARREDRLESLAADLESAHDVTVAVVPTDVTDEDAVAALVDAAVERFGGLDVLVNNAGIFIAGDSQEISIEEFDQVIGVDLAGAFYCAKFAIPHLKESKGQIVNIGSVNSQEGGGGPPYASAKAAIVNLTRDLAVELGDDEVNVNAICPGFVETPIQDYQTEEELRTQLDQTLLPYVATPEDVGNAAVFLASEEARFVHGESLYVDGGWTAHSL